MEETVDLVDEHQDSSRCSSRPTASGVEEGRVAVELAGEGEEEGDVAFGFADVLAEEGGGTEGEEGDAFFSAGYG